MVTGIAHSNKDILMKALSQLYQNKSLAVYGLNIPRIKRMLPSNYPSVSANEYRGDNAFILEDDTLYIQEYESSVKHFDDFIKYTQYVCFALKQLRTEGVAVKQVIIGIIYTGDILTAPNVWDIGAINVQVQQVFLSRFDTNSIYHDIQKKIVSNEELADEDMLKLIILPLTQPEESRKQQLIEDTITLAKQIRDESKQLFAVAGILTATDKFINREYSDQIKEWIRMTKVARLFEEEKMDAVNKAVVETRNETLITIAKSLLSDGDDYVKVMKHTGLTLDEVVQIHKSLGLGKLIAG